MSIATTGECPVSAEKLGWALGELQFFRKEEEGRLEEWRQELADMKEREAQISLQGWKGRLFFWRRFVLGWLHFSEWFEEGGIETSEELVGIYGEAEECLARGDVESCIARINKAMWIQHSVAPTVSTTTGETSGLMDNGLVISPVNFRLVGLIQELRGG